MIDAVDRKLVRRDFSDHNQYNGPRYDVLAKNKDGYDRDTVIGKAKFEPHTQFNDGLKGQDVVHFMERVVEDSEVYLFDEDKLNQTEKKALKIQEKIQEQLQKRQELLESLKEKTTGEGDAVSE